jgi:hypothetical protein
MKKEYTIYAVKAVQPWEEESDAEYWIPLLYEELKKGRARLGWGYYDEADLRKIKAKMEKKGWKSLSEDEKDTWKHTGFIFDYEVQDGDYFIYINMPEYGKCSIVKIVGDNRSLYTFSKVWTKEKEDNFRHLISCKFIGTFDRNSSIVHPFLRRRLGLQGAWYRIRSEEDDKEEFEELLNAIKEGTKGKSGTERLSGQIDKHLTEIVKEIHHNFPAHTLEDLILEVYKKLPNVIDVRKGPDINGADLEVEFENGLGAGGLQKRELCAVQVKSYKGEMDSTRAIEDIKKAFRSNPGYTCGLIISTAQNITEDFEKELDKLREEKYVDILFGKDLAYLLTKYGID